MPRTVLFYISGHGYGHATRSAEVARHLMAGGFAGEICIRSSAPARFFSDIPGVRTIGGDLAIDAAAVEDSPLVVSPVRTIERAAEVLRRRHALVSAEVDLVRQAKPGVVVADVPFLAGDVAEALGLPCLALSNFTWDWIYEPFVRAHPQGEEVVHLAGSSYAKMAGWLRLPFGHASSRFGRVTDIPLVARRPTRTPVEVVAALGLDAADPRPRVLIAMRGGISPSVLQAAAAGAGDLVLLCPGEVPTGSPENLRAVDLTGGIPFTDLVSACDLVLSKLGYGIVSDCIVSGVGILWPRRSGFREDELTAAHHPCTPPYQLHRWKICMLGA